MHALACPLYFDHSTIDVGYVVYTIYDNTRGGHDCNFSAHATVGVNTKVHLCVANTLYSAYMSETVATLQFVYSHTHTLNTHKHAYSRK